MQHLNIALGLLLQNDTFLLQLRNGKHQAGKLGHIGCFGGQIEPGESAVQAVCREIREESTFSPSPDAAELVAEVDVLSERHDKSISVHATIYRFMVPAGEQMQAKEGELVTMTLTEMRQNLHTLTPALREYVEQTA